MRCEVAALVEPDLIVEYRSRLAALESYVAAKQDERGLFEARMAQRWVETRIGELLGPAEQTWTGKPSSTSLASEVLTPNERPKRLQQPLDELFGAPLSPGGTGLLPIGASL